MKRGKSFIMISILVLMKIMGKAAYRMRSFNFLFAVS
jgi:hypothetical protein